MTNEKLLEQAFKLYLKLSGKDPKKEIFETSIPSVWRTEDATMCSYRKIGTCSLHYAGKDYILYNENLVGFIEVVDGKVYVTYQKYDDGIWHKLEKYEPWMKVVSETAAEFCEETGLTLWCY